MVAILCGEESDKYVDLAELSLAYYISHPHTPTIYNYALFLSNAIDERFEGLDAKEHFPYVSLLVWLLIYQHPEIFLTLQFQKFDVNGNEIFVDS